MYKIIVTLRVVSMTSTGHGKKPGGQHAERSSPPPKRLVPWEGLHSEGAEAHKQCKTLRVHCRQSRPLPPFQCRASQPQHCFHLESDHSFLREPAPALPEVQQNPWPLPTGCLQNLPSRNNQICLQTLPHVPWGSILPQVETHCPGVPFICLG